MNKTTLIGSNFGFRVETPFKEGIEEKIHALTFPRLECKGSVYEVFPHTESYIVTIGFEGYPSSMDLAMVKMALEDMNLE